MDFSLEQLMQYNNYNEVCETFFSLAKDEETLAKLKEILYTGKVGDYKCKSKFRCRDNPSIERARRIAIASSLLRDPKTFAFFEQNNINIFHGTNANALPSILKYGLNSQDALEAEGIPVLTGEEWSRMYRKRQFISFTDVLDIAQYYSHLSSPKGQEDMSFSIIIGVNEEQMSKARVVQIGSDVSEIGVIQHFPIESISCICVPEDKIEFVKRMIGNLPITVLGMQDLDQKAFYVDEFESTMISHELYETKPVNNKFSLGEIRQMVASRGFGKIKEFVERVKNVFVKGEEEEVGRSIR